MPDFKTVQSWSRQQAEARAQAVKATIDIYREQATRDYQLLRSTKERNIVLAHLALRDPNVVGTKGNLDALSCISEAIFTDSSYGNPSHGFWATPFSAVRDLSANQDACSGNDYSFSNPETGLIKNLLESVSAPN
jgi:hypothetical protein